MLDKKLNTHMILTKKEIGYNIIIKERQDQDKKEKWQKSVQIK